MIQSKIVPDFRAPRRERPLILDSGGLSRKRNQFSGFGLSTDRFSYFNMQRVPIVPDE